MFKSDIQTYINNFRRRISAYLRPGLGIKAIVNPAEDGGAVLVFEIGAGVANVDEFRASQSTVNAALAGIEQHTFEGSLQGIRFGGTNTILEPGKIILIKDGSHSEWTDAAAAKDVKVIVPHAGEPSA